MDLTSSTIAIHGRRLLVALACALTLVWMVCTGSAYGQSTGLGAGQPGDVSATLVQCVTTGEPAERSATFSGEMTMIPGAARMTMRIELLERMPGETGYRTVVAPGLGVWRPSDPGVRVYKYLKQVTNLSGPAVYRALVSFRWQGPRGRVLKSLERRTPRCTQPAPPAVQPAPPAPMPSPPLETPSGAAAGGLAHTLALGPR